MNIEKKNWRLSAPLITTLTALFVIAGLLLAGWLNARRYRVRARVEIADPTIAQEYTPAPIAGHAAGLPDGEVARTAVRVREASGLLLGLAVLAISEQMQRSVALNAQALTALLSQRQLLPPGLTLTTTPGALHSEFATLSVRYRAQPFGLEIISLAREKTDGPPLLVRLATDSTDETGALLFIARKAEAPIPTAFASPAQISAMNWTSEPLRESALDAREMNQLKAWARQYATQGK